MNIARTAAIIAASGQTVMIVGATPENAGHPHEVLPYRALHEILPYRTTEIARRTKHRLDYRTGGQIHVTKKENFTRATRGLTIDYLILTDYTPLLEPDFLEAVHTAFNGETPQISVIG